MIERLVFISTMVFFLMIGVNAFLIVGNGLLLPNGQALNLFDSTDTSHLDPNYIYNQSQGVQTNANGATTATTSAPGTAQSIDFMTYNGQSSGFLGLDFIKNALFGANLVGLKLAALYPQLGVIILIPVAIISALQAFFFMYWGMAGVRAFFGRFL